MIFEHRVEYSGHVKLQISGGERGTIDYPWQDNMIVDAGFIALASGANSSNYDMLQIFKVGASSQPVVPTDTDIVSKIAEGMRTASSEGWNNDGQFGWSRSVRAFPRGAAAGNISELTVGGQLGILSRTLVKDASGNPATITVLSDEVLTVTWELRRYWNVPSDFSLDYDDDGVTKTTTVSFLPLAAIPKTLEGGVGAGGGKAHGGSLVSSSGGVFVSETVSLFTEAQGNPAVSKLSTTTYNSSRAGEFAMPFIANYATFNPPIAKTNEFRLAIYWRLTLTRRAP